MQLYPYAEYMMSLVEMVLRSLQSFANQLGFNFGPKRAGDCQKAICHESPVSKSGTSARTGGKLKHVAPSTSSRAFKVLSTDLQPKNADTQFWWEATGPLLATLLQQAGYDDAAQDKVLKFHCDVVSSKLGPHPTPMAEPKTWRSFMTDDFSPVELSWSWDSPGSQSHPRIRYSVEAIGADAGTAADPLNQKAALDLVGQIGPISPISNWQWFTSMAKVLCPSTLQLSGKRHELWSGSDTSSMALGFEFREQGLGVKAYLAPIKAAVTGQSSLEVITEGIRSLETENLRFPAFDNVLSYVKNDPVGRSLEILGIALDCVDPSMARLKLYARSSDTCFNTVRQTMRVGSFAINQSESALDDLWSLWQSVVQHGPNFSPGDQLRRNAHATSGILYNFEFKAGLPFIDTKVYIPVKHYGASDHAIAEGLTNFLASRGRGSFTAQYFQAIEEMCQHRSLKDSRGLQTYIQCGLQQDSVSVTSYFTPEIYHPAKWSAA